MKKFFKEWCVPAFIALCIVLLLTNFVFQIARVPSGSMIPTIEIGDWLFVNKMINNNELKRGEIIVFDSNEEDKLLVKRLIGLPGEKVEIKRNGKVFIDGELLDEPYAVPNIQSERTFDVPKDCYFFLGDNRPNSKDARYWENPYINKESIEGRVDFRVFPLNRIGKLD